MYAIEINQVTKKFNSFKALSNINFKIERGDFVGLLGVNGAGKTTLISAIAGLINYHGQIKVMGYDLAKDIVLAKKSLGVVPQELAFDPFNTVYRTLSLQSGLYGVKNNHKWIMEVLDRLYLSDKVNANTRSLSGGMKRRLMVAQALVHRPPVIILDEPTVGVDVEIRKNLWDFITELHNKGHTILLTTHYLEEVEKLSNKIIMMDKGEIIAEKTKVDFISMATDLPFSLEVLLSGDLSILNTALIQQVSKREGNLLTFQLKTNSEIANLIMQISNLGIKIENVEINKPRLEEVFLSYLGH